MTIVSDQAAAIEKVCADFKTAIDSAVNEDGEWYDEKRNGGFYCGMAQAYSDCLNLLRVLSVPMIVDISHKATAEEILLLEDRYLRGYQTGQLMIRETFTDE
ncbi:hypothetical protein PBI_GRAYSON_147 [Rhodococcus phage Grayson]|nr:hypothetical protein PBI_GRAYSON_147 [Rhodococcus phage Grayson]